ncbi:MAG TPA: hypothetical protein VFZ25_09500 [Chloroflexota bacterium]|nr:hypothetical protein [Chloroflexota bacterium]
MRRRGANWPLLVGLVGAVAGAAAVALLPEAEPVRERLKEVPGLLAELPERARALRREAEARLDQAKLAFLNARAESERALILQLREAKDRGSLPPV